MQPRGLTAALPETSARTVTHRRLVSGPNSSRRWVIGYLFILPTLVFVGVFSYYPAVKAMQGAFSNWNGFNPPVFVGLGNFVQMFQDPVFIASLWHVLIWTVVGIPLSLIPPFLVAEMIFHLGKARSQYVFRTMFIVPMVLPGFVGLLIWLFIYQPTGLLNQFLGAVGLGFLRHQWLADPHTALGALIGMGFPWIGAFQLLVLYAGLQAIPMEILDAAAVDGVGTWSRIRAIDIPMIRGQWKLLFILAIVSVPQNLIAPLILTDGGPGTATVTPVFYMYQTAIGYGLYGYGMAIAFLLFLVMMLLAIVNMKYIQSQPD